MLRSAVWMFRIPGGSAVRVVEANGIAVPAIKVLDVETILLSQRKSRLNPRPAATGKPGHSARRLWTISA